MAIGDILSGFADAAHEHKTMLFNMQEQQNKELANHYATLAQDQNSPPEVREEAEKRFIGFHTLEPGKKPPKEWTNFTFELPPKPQAAPAPAVAPAPAPAEGAADTATSQNPQTVQVTAPAPPPRVNMGARYSPEELAAQAGAKAGAIAGAQEPSKEDAIKAKADADLAKAKNDMKAKLVIAGLSSQQVPQFDINGDFTSFRKMTPEELSQIQTANTNKAQAQANASQSTADVNQTRIKVGALAKTLPTDIQTYNMYADQMKERGQVPETIDKYLERIHPSNAAAKTYMVKTLDTDPSSPTYGQPISMIVGNTVGATFIAQPPAAEQNRTLQAARVMPVVDDALDVINKHPEIVGPLDGRIEAGKFIVGNPDPKYAQLGTILGSVAAMMPILHGFRGGSQALDHFSVIIGDPHLNADALKQSLFAIKRLALEIQTGQAVPVDEETGEPLIQPRAAILPSNSKSTTPAPRPGTAPKKPLSSFERGGVPAPAPAPARGR